MGIFFEIVFWGALTMVLYTFAGYPVLIGVLAVCRKGRTARIVSAGGDKLPIVSIVLCVHNEEDRILDRLKNLLESNYPGDCLDVVVVSDGSTDQTEEKIRAFADPRVRVLVEPVPSGKAHCLNVALRGGARGSIVVFADARQRFELKTIMCLVRQFSDERVGAVSGRLLIHGASSGTGDGVGLYWQLETFIRWGESALGSTIGCTGAVYAIRKELFQPLPSDTILDDVLIPMRILCRGHRVVFEPDALARDPQPLDPPSEHVRKRRTLAGNFQLLFRYPEWLLPSRNRAWWQLISHKYLRLSGPWFLLAMLGASAALMGHPGYFALLVCQMGFYGVGVAGLLFPRLRISLVSVSAGFLFLNAMAVAGLISYLRGTYGGRWRSGSRSGQKAESRSFP